MFLCFFGIGHQAQSQFLAKIFKIDSIDNRYYSNFDTLTNTRLYLSQKLTNPTLKSGDGKHLLRYRSNGNTNLGIGNTYGWLTINIGLKFRAINHDDDVRGKTRFLDLHTQIVGRPYVVDFFGQFYKGAYLMPEKGDLPDGTKYPLRPDLYTELIGFSSYYIPNWKRFSYAALVTQRDWQKKSAGSPLLGFEFFTGRISGDSALVPPDRDWQPGYREINKVRFYEVAFGVGYAYSLVIKKHWFVSASAITTLSGGIMNQYAFGLASSSLYLRPNFLIRPSFGFNSNRFNGSVYLFANQVNAGNSNGVYRINNSNFRVTFAYRFNPSPGFKKKYQILLNMKPRLKKKEKKQDEPKFAIPLPLPARYE